MRKSAYRRVVQLVRRGEAAFVAWHSFPLCRRRAMLSDAHTSYGLFSQILFHGETLGILRVTKQQRLRSL